LQIHDAVLSEVRGKQVVPAALSMIQVKKEILFAYFEEDLVEVAR
jgi:hypothetical protein